MLGENLMEEAWFWKALTSERQVSWDVCLSISALVHTSTCIIISKRFWNRPGNETKSYCVLPTYTSINFHNSVQLVNVVL